MRSARGSRPLWVGAGFLWLAACSSMPVGPDGGTGTGGVPTTGGSSSGGTTGGGSGLASLTGPSSLTFPVAFVGYAVRGSVEPGNELFVVFSNVDLSSQCASDGGPALQTGQEVLELRVVGSNGQAVAADTYAIGGDPFAGGSGAGLLETQATADGGRGVALGAAANGTLQLTDVGGPVTGSFTVQMNGAPASCDGSPPCADGGVIGELYSSFAAVACSALGN